MGILTAFFGMIGSFVSTIILYFVKKFGYSAVLFTLQKSVQVVFIALLLSFSYWFTGFVLNIWNLISTLVYDFQNVDVGSGSSYGISLSVILENTKGFIYASGLSTAFVTAGNLLMSILSIIFIKAVYQVYIKVVSKLYDIFASGINLLSGATRL